MEQKLSLIKRRLKARETFKSILLLTSLFLRHTIICFDCKELSYQLSGVFNVSTDSETILQKAFIDKKK